MKYLAKVRQVVEFTMTVDADPATVTPLLNEALENDLRSDSIKILDEDYDPALAEYEVLSLTEVPLQ